MFVSRVKFCLFFLRFCLSFLWCVFLWGLDVFERFPNHLLQGFMVFGLVVALLSLFSSIAWMSSSFW